MLLITYKGVHLVTCAVHRQRNLKVNQTFLLIINFSESEHTRKTILVKSGVIQVSQQTSNNG